MQDDGYAMVISTALNGRPVLRLCPINPGARLEEIAETVARLGRFAEQTAVLETVDGRR